MLFTQKLIILFGTMASVSATPGLAPVMEVVTDGDFTYTGAAW